ANGERCMGWLHTLQARLRPFGGSVSARTATHVLAWLHVALRDGTFAGLGPATGEDAAGTVVAFGYAVAAKILPRLFAAWRRREARDHRTAGLARLYGWALAPKRPLADEPDVGLADEPPAGATLPRTAALALREWHGSAVQP